MTFLLEEEITEHATLTEISYFGKKSPVGGNTYTAVENKKDKASSTGTTSVSYNNTKLDIYTY